MSIKIDAYDKKILFELDRNARQSNAKIAKTVCLSKQVVGFRIKRLLKENVVSSFYTVIDISKLGFTIHKTFLRLQNLNSEKEHELITFLKNHKNVVWVASCDGKFDLVFGTWAKDMAFLDKTLKEINKEFGDYISERQIATIIHGEYFVRNYLVEKKKQSDSRESFFGSTPSAIEMDKTNWDVLKALGENARATAVYIGKKIKVSADTVSQRIKKHYNLVPNEETFPFLHYKILIGLRNTSEGRENALVEFCRKHPHIVYVVNALGSWEFEIDIEVESAEQLREILMEIKTNFNDILKDYSTLHIYKVHKYNFCPSIQLQ